MPVLCSSQHHDVTITGGTFTEVQGNVNHYHIKGNYHNHNTEGGLHILSQFTSLGAIHDSSERFPPPKCHPDTRHEVIRIVMRWIEDDNPDSSVFWIYGPAGAGKSAIAQTLAELIQASGGRYGGSFFFSRGKIGRDQAHHLFTTIAYQLAFHNTSFREHLNQILYENPTLPTKPINIQMQALIVEPLAKLNGSLHSIPVIIVDGLDECNGHDAQQLILTVIAEALRKSRTSLRFLVASRPEAHIRETFDSNQLYAMTRRLVLDENFNPNKDIEIYLKDGFNDIYEQHKQFMTNIEKPWPSDGVIDLLVQKASGQFIYAATVLKFVGEEYYRPNKQLDIVLQPTPRRSTAFPDLDALYTQILLTCPHRASLLPILGTILTFHCPQLPEVIEDIFQMERNEVNLVLRSLRSLVRIPGIECRGSQHDEEAEEEDGEGLRFYHASFHDFLVDEDRSGPFYINLEDFLSKFTTSGFRVISRFTPATFTSSFNSRPDNLPIIQTWGYFKWHLSPHFWSCTETVRSAIILDLEAAVQRFWINTLDDNTAEVSFDALHCALTALVHMMYTKRKWYEGRQHRWDGGMDITLDYLVDEYPEDPEKKLDENIASVFYKFRNVLDACYAKAFSLSCMNELIESVPGFLVLRTENTIDNLATIVGVDIEIVRGLVEKNRPFIRFNRYTDPSDYIVLKAHVKDYICDQSRSGFYYHDRKPHHISISRRCLWLMFENPWSVLDNLASDVKEYFHKNLHDHLYESDIGPLDHLSSDDPVMDLIGDLSRYIYYCEGHWSTPHLSLLYTWFAVIYVFRWLQRQQEALIFEDQNTDIYVEMEERIRFIIDRIYGQILHPLRTSVTETLVSLCPPFLEAQKFAYTSPRPSDDSDNAPSDEPPPVFKIPTVVTLPECDQTPNANAIVRVSDDFLLFKDIIPSLTDYLTDPYRAGNLFIRSEVFHMQLAEYYLDRCSGSGIKLPDPEDPIEKAKKKDSKRNLTCHLFQALPSERIYARLRTIYPFNLIGSPGPFIDSLKGVVTWLEGHPQPPLDIYIKWQKEILNEEAYEAKSLLAPATPDPISLIRKAIQWWLSFRVDWNQLSWRIFIFFEQLYLSNFYS